VAVPVLVQGQATDTSVTSGKGSVSVSQRGVTGASGQRQFDLQFRPVETGELFTGSIRVTGADGFTGGSLGDADWKLDGSRLTGKIVRGEMTVVTFEGTMNEEETSGTFVTAGGRTGSWTWEGPPPGEYHK
jgi:hypothetical protein